MQGWRSRSAGPGRPRPPFREPDKCLRSYRPSLRKRQPCPSTINCGMRPNDMVEDSAPAQRRSRERHCHADGHSPFSQSMVNVQGCRSRSAGLGRPRPSGARHALRPSRARGRGKTGGAIQRGEFLACDPCCPDNPLRICAPGICRPRASVLAAGASAARVRAQPVFRLAEAGLGRPGPALRSRQPV